MSKLKMVPKVAAQGVLGVFIFGLYIFFYLLFIGAVVTGGLAVYNHVTSHLHHSQSNSSSSSPQEYTSTEGSFRIAFPGGLPTVKNYNGAVQGSNVTYTSYYTLTDNGNKQYYVTEYNIPTSLVNASSLSTADLQTELQSELNTYAQQQKAQITSSSFTSFQSITAIQAQLSASSTTSYYLSLFKGNNLFVINTWGASKSDYQNFVNSFKFIQ